MPQITAYQCPKTQQLFADRELFRENLHAQLAKSHIVARQKNLAKKFIDKITLAQQTLTTVEEIRTWVFEHVEDIMAYKYSQYVLGLMKGNFYGGRMDYAAWRGDFELTGLHFHGKYTAEIRNSHGAPHGKKTNWCNRLPEEPSHYPGISGNVTMSSTGNCHMFSTELFKIPGIYAGGGGGSPASERYGLIIWFDDWTALAEAHGMKAMEDKIRGQ